MSGEINWVELPAADNRPGVPTSPKRINDSYPNMTEFWQIRGSGNAGERVGTSSPRASRSTIVRI